MTSSSKKPLKILYAIQGTGNGHVARAREIIPLLQQFGELDIVLSGDQSEVNLPCEITYRSKGLTFVYNRKGGLSYWKTIFKNDLLKIINEVRSFPVNNYDVIINDFEFITAWACKIRGKRCFGLGHQVAFLSPKVPRPSKKSRIGEFILKNYAPCTDRIGFHFDHFDDFVEKPVIRSEIRQAQISNKGHYTVYLPAYSDEKLTEFLSLIQNVEWHIFSKNCTKAYSYKNLSFSPVSNQSFIKSFTSCEGLLTSAGFESPAEAIYMGKKLFVIPIKGQYEQFCNAEAMKTLGIPSIKLLNHNTLEELKRWVANSSPIQVNYPDQTKEIIQKRIFDKLDKGH